MRLETERLILRTLEQSDAFDLHAIMNDPEVTHNLLIPHPFPEDGMAAWIEERREALDRREKFLLAVTGRDTGKVMGISGLISVSWEHLNAELVYWLGKAHWGQGYMTEAGRRILEFGFNELLLERISVGCFTRNEASARVIEKLGFKYEGLARREYRKDAEFMDVHHYSMLRSEFPCV